MSEFLKIGSRWINTNCIREITEQDGEYWIYLIGMKDEQRIQPMLDSKQHLVQFLEQQEWTARELPAKP